MPSGAALGPLLASFVLLPTVGFQWSLLLSAASYTLLALLISERGSWSFKRPLGIARTCRLRQSGGHQGPWVAESRKGKLMPDLVAGALARRDFDDVIRLLESEKKLGALELNDLFILTYVYCLAGEVKKAENLVASNSGLIKRDWFVDWLWGKLQAEFGFHPPP